MAIVNFKQGSKLRIAISVTHPDYTMDDYDFEVKLYINSTSEYIIFSKSELLRESENRYIALLDTSIFKDKKGVIRYEFIPKITTDVGDVEPIIGKESCIAIVR